MKSQSRNRSRKLLFLTLFSAIVYFSACNSAILIHTTEEVPNGIWTVSDTLSSSFVVTDTFHVHNIWINTRLSQEYAFSNLYLSYTLLGPGGMNISEVTDFQVTNKAGKWLGSGFAELHSYSFPIFENLPLKTMGTYRVNVVQHMRVDDLAGVKDRGIKVETGQEIF
ncbi:MAG: gliding motility-associated lipoprotein GldH [Bacteroidia bacterium]|jgi:gliding motility-associated lipoprotein GldH